MVYVNLSRETLVMTPVTVPFFYIIFISVGGNVLEREREFFLILFIFIFS